MNAGWLNIASSANAGANNSFGPGFNVNGTSVTFAFDDPSNMFADGGFEQSPTLGQWTQSPAGSFSIDATIFFSGTQSCKSSTPNAFLYQTVRCNVGDQFVLSVYSRTSGPAAGTSACVLRFRDSAGGFLSQAVTNVTAGTAWVQYVVSGTAPANAFFVEAWPINVSVTAGGVWYVDACLLRRIADGNAVAVGAIQTTHLAAGSLGDLSKYSSTVRAVGITSGQPTLPDANYPNGAIIFNTFDGKLYRNVSGTWSKGSDPADIIAGTIAAGVVYAGTINCSQLNAGTLSAGVIYAGAINCSQLTAGTMTVSSISSGIDVLYVSDSRTTRIRPRSIQTINAAGHDCFFLDDSNGFNNGGNAKIGDGTGGYGIILAGADGTITLSTSVRIGAVQVVGARQTGWTAATGTATRTSFATGSVTLANLAQAVKAIIDDLITHGIIGS